MTDLASLLAQKFIARPDVKAVQNRRGEYMPVQHCTECGRGFCDHESEKVRERWTRTDIDAHLTGQKTYGHYLLNQDSKCKFFAFDIDLDKPGLWEKDDPSIKPVYPFPYKITDNAADDPWGANGEFLGEEVEFDPRQAWLDRAHPARDWMKRQLKTVAHVLAKSIIDTLGLPAAVTYTGAKGMHVYGLTGLIPARDAREGAQIILDDLANTSLGEVYPIRGDVFYRTKNQDVETGQPNITIEVFPKQTSLDGMSLGNLMRLPLGVNLKNPKDPTFFVDMASGLTSLKGVDPTWALSTSNIFRAPGE
jgi:hypothetical protein